MKTPPTPKSNLDMLEKMIGTMLTEVMKKNSVNENGEKYSLTDRMKVVDRALKLEDIKNKMSDDEGAFFTVKSPDDDEGAE